MKSKNILLISFLLFITFFSYKINAQLPVPSINWEYPFATCQPSTPTACQIYLSQITTDAYGNIYGVGMQNWPDACGGPTFGFIVKLDANGNLLGETTFGGRPYYWNPMSIAISPDGSIIYIAGFESSGVPDNFNAFMAIYPNPSDWSTAPPVTQMIQIGTQAQGGTMNPFDVATHVTCDNDGNAYVVGTTNSTSHIAYNAPIANSTYIGGNSDGFIAKFNSSGTELWGEYYGGMYTDEIFSCTYYNNYIYLIGYTDSPSNISYGSGVYQGSNMGGTDAFVVKMDLNGITQWATYYGGTGDDYGHDLIINPSNSDLYIIGSTSSDNTNNNIATKGITSNNAIIQYPSYTEDIFIAALNSNNGSRIWGTYCGFNTSSYSNWTSIFNGYNSIFQDEYYPNEGTDPNQCPGGPKTSASIYIDNCNNIYITGGVNYILSPPLEVPPCSKQNPEHTPDNPYTVISKYNNVSDNNWNGLASWSTYYYLTNPLINHGYHYISEGCSIVFSNNNIFVGGYSYYSFASGYHYDYISSFSEGCAQNITLTSNNYSSAEFERDDYITAESNYDISDGDEIIFSAGNKVNLEPGFSALNGSIFQAKIGGCNSNCVNSSSRKTNNNSNNSIESEDKLTTKKNFNVFPNPNNGNMQVAYEIPENTIGTFSIYDMLGKQLLSYPLYSGKNTLTISEESLNQGIYFYRAFSRNKQIAADKIVIIK
jgi:hypothetical protein